VLFFERRNISENTVAMIKKVPVEDAPQPQPGTKDNRSPAPSAPPAPLRIADPAAITRSQSVTERLREAILAGQFSPAEKLQEVPLSKMLDVSRTPIRAALHRLAAEGMLEYAPNRGYSVRNLATKELLEVIDIRGVLEGLAARFAAERGLTPQLEMSYREALADGDRLLAKGLLLQEDKPLFRDVNVRIHDAIGQASGNRMINDMIRLCHNVPMSSDRNILWDEYRWKLRSHDDHHRLFEAIVAREPWRAEQLMREHIHSIKSQLREQLAGRALPGDAVSADAG
jgi:GntR family transcriptional regulator, vanillate catabolism transcriptional regulator